MPISPLRCPTPSEKLDWIRLIRSENVGPITFRRLLQRFGSAKQALAALPDLARRGGQTKAIRIYSEREARRELEKLTAAGGRMLFLGETDYPPLLAHIEDAPPLLSIIGHDKILERPAVGIVGARNASVAGQRFAKRIASELGAAGLIVVSGLARGIDAAAHQGALATGTIAVMAGGVDSVYPRQNDALYGEIAEHGAIVSEMPLGTVARARDFPRRNRLVSGLGMGVVVIEAGARSGSLITARMSLEQGRDVFAVPGAPTDPRSSGGNDLIRQGAILTESADDVLGVLNGLETKSLEEPQPIDFIDAIPISVDAAEVEKARSAIEESLSSVPVTVDEIIRNCQFSPSVVSVVLLDMELAGRLERHPGHQVSLLQGN